MPTYVSFFSYTGEAWRDMVRRPADRAEAARVAIENAGGTMLSFYWMLGEYDGFVVYEMPDEVAASAYASAVAATGRIDRHKTYQAIAMDDAQRALKLAAEVKRTYRAPGAPADWRIDYEEGRG